MKHALHALTLALAAQTAAIAAGPQSVPCQQALAALEARESELAAAAQPQAPGRAATDARWLSLRAQAARACLAGETAALAPSPRVAPAPIVVAPVSIGPSPLPTTLRAPPAALPRPKPPPAVMSCDPNGCWTRDGVRMPHAGRDPLDPRVQCSVQGQLVVCL